jgi:hypothetical protein
MEKTQLTELGRDPAGNSVSAATDGAGPQVIVLGKGVHMLSRPLKDHKAAVVLGKSVVERGTGVYGEWFDLMKGGVSTNLFAVFGGPFRGGYVDSTIARKFERDLREGARRLTKKGGRG